ncbi:circadian clock protein KaiC [Aestuariibius sp. 2305UL40-4]|uniref:circadian clock protein KaiC n=1 Tax=Aestuariibius violaceus TaxID=3234132 RepID=UPI00345E2BC5
MIERFKTGIEGFDQLTGGGLPKDRTTLVTGGSGCGKTLFMLSILARGLLSRGEPAVFLSFEERPRDLIDNAASIGLDLQDFIDRDLLHIDHIVPPREGMTAVGEYTLDGLKLRIEMALKSIGAAYLALDTIETLFLMFEDERAIRGELVRLLNYLSDTGVTTIMSGEKGDGRVTRRGFEEYISDCVIVLENDTMGDVATRRLRVIKYRGAHHGPNKYPFLIDEQGVTIMPLTSALFDHTVSSDRLTTGTAALDEALGGGIRRGSTVLLSGGSGTGKTILASLTVEAACQLGERALYMSFEESPKELIENVRSAGIDLKTPREDGTLVISSARPTLMGLERHLVELYRLVESHRPNLVVIDPISSLSTAGDRDAVYRTTVRMIDYLKRHGITAILAMEPTEAEDRDRAIVFSSILDTLIELSSEVDEDGINRHLQIIKARGIAHDHRRIAFHIGKSGVVLEADDG